MFNYLFNCVQVHSTWINKPFQSKLIISPERSPLIGFNFKNLEHTIEIGGHWLRGWEAVGLLVIGGIACKAGSLLLRRSGQQTLNRKRIQTGDGGRHCRWCHVWKKIGKFLKRFGGLSIGQRGHRILKIVCARLMHYY